MTAILFVFSRFGFVAVHDLSGDEHDFYWHLRLLQGCRKSCAAGCQVCCAEMTDV